MDGRARGWHDSLVSMHGTRHKVHDLTPGDIARLVQALLDGIERGELEASPREVEFLASIEELLSPA